MRPISRSLLLYLLIVGLLTVNIIFVADYPLSGFIIYIVIFFVVFFYSGKSLFWGDEAGPGFRFGIALIGAVLILEILGGLLKFERFEFNPGILISAIVFQSLVALGEEISFRGFILKNLADEAGIKAGVIISSLMFSSIHLPSFIYYGLDASRGALAFIVIGMLGVIVSIIYLNYGLGSAITFHFTWNFLQYNVLDLSGAQPGMIKISYIGPDILTGGNFGPEAGILGFIIVLAAMMIFIKKYSKSLN